MPGACIVRKMLVPSHSLSCLMLIVVCTLSLSSLSLPPTLSPADAIPLATPLLGRMHSFSGRATYITYVRRQHSGPLWGKKEREPSCHPSITHPSSIDRSMRVYGMRIAFQSVFGAQRNTIMLPPLLGSRRVMKRLPITPPHSKLQQWGGWRRYMCLIDHQGEPCPNAVRQSALGCGWAKWLSTLLFY